MIEIFRIYNDDVLAPLDRLINIFIHNYAKIRKLFVTLEEFVGFLSI